MFCPVGIILNLHHSKLLSPVVADEEGEGSETEQHLVHLSLLCDLFNNATMEALF
jgi:hypothetical protein